MNNEKTGEFIKGLLEEHQMNQSDLAKVLNITDAAVSKNLNGKSSFDLSNLSIISKLFDVTIDELVQAKRSSEKLFSSDLERIAHDGIETVKKLQMEKNIGLRGTDTNGKTLIEYAMINDNVELVRHIVNNYLYPELLNYEGKKVPLYKHPMYLKFVLRHEMTDLFFTSYWSVLSESTSRSGKSSNLDKSVAIADYTGKNVIYVKKHRLAYDFSKKDFAEEAVKITDINLFDELLKKIQGTGETKWISASQKCNIFGWEFGPFTKEQKMVRENQSQIQMDRRSTGNLFYLYTLCIEEKNIALFDYIDQRIKLTSDHLYYFIEQGQMGMVKHIIETRRGIHLDLGILLEMGGTDLVDKINKWNKGNE